MCSGQKFEQQNKQSNMWRFSRQITVSVVIELVLLASLIIGSWVNLQRQLDILQHDVELLLRSQKQFQEKLESVQLKCVSHEYRLQNVEQVVDRNPARTQKD